MEITGNALYGQSGGPTSVINSSAYGLITEAFKHKDRIGKVYCARYGVDGIINDDLILLDETKDEENIFLLKQTPGAAFGSTRHKLKTYKEDGATYERILEIFAKYNIRFFFYNGGNDSMDTINKLNEYFKQSSYKCYLIGIPKTIDNDLVLTDHCPGFGSAGKYIANSFSSLAADASSYKAGRINIVEIMGRDTGYLTLCSALGQYKPDLIYIPEVPFDIDEFISKVEKIYAEKKMCYIAVSEGIKDKDGNFISALGAKDSFNHAQLGGVGAYLSSYLTEKGYKTRAIEFSLVQRSATYITSLSDQKEAILAGSYACRSALKGKSGFMVCFKRKPGQKYKVSCFLAPLDKIGGMTKLVTLNMLNSSKDNISEEFLSYALPLIKGEIKCLYADGTMKFSSFLED